VAVKGVDARERPIGVFDSGLGGLTVLQAIVRRLPAEHTVYLGDTARLPYGTKSPETVVRYSLQTTALLVERGVKLLVVACNTASATALPAVAARWNVPVVGVIEPGARAAVAASRRGRIGVIGTRGTVASGAYERAIAGLRPGAGVIAAACPLFVPLAEEGWTANRVAALAAAEYLAPLKSAGVDTLLLGCTHYPLLAGVIAAEMGPEVTLIDSAVETAGQVAGLLEGAGLARRGDEQGTREFLVTDLPAQFGEVGRRFFGDELRSVRLVDIRGDGTPPEETT
jgi:glutamate racemase